MGGSVADEIPHRGLIAKGFLARADERREPLVEGFRARLSADILGERMPPRLTGRDGSPEAITTAVVVTPEAAGSSRQWSASRPWCLKQDA